MAPFKFFSELYPNPRIHNKDSHLKQRVSGIVVYSWIVPIFSTNAAGTLAADYTKALLAAIFRWQFQLFAEGW